jgi:hypothetical protein
MQKVSFFSSEPLFFKCIYILGFIGAFYVIYETIFVEEELHSGIIFYLLVLFGFYNLRKSYVIQQHKKLPKTHKLK